MSAFHVRVGVRLDERDPVVVGEHVAVELFSGFAAKVLQELEFVRVSVANDFFDEATEAEEENQVADAMDRFLIE